MLYRFYKIILKNTRESKTLQSCLHTLTDLNTYRPMRASVVAELFHNDNYIMKKSFHSLGILTNIEKNINNFALAHQFLDCIARKLQDCWRTATLSVVLKILKFHCSARVTCEPHTYHARVALTPRAINTYQGTRVRNLKSFSPKRGSISITTCLPVLKFKV